METVSVCETVDLNCIKQLADREVMLHFVATELQYIMMKMMMTMVTITITTTTTIIIIMFVLQFFYLMAGEYLLQHEPSHSTVCSMSLSGSIQ